MGCFLVTGRHNLRLPCRGSARSTPASTCAQPAPRDVCVDGSCRPCSFLPANAAICPPPQPRPTGCPLSQLATCAPVRWTAGWHRSQLCPAGRAGSLTREGGIRQGGVDATLHERAAIIVLDEAKPLRAVKSARSGQCRLHDCPCTTGRRRSALCRHRPWGSRCRAMPQAS